ncbi:Thiol:disulfide oxidoreductase TlpA [invertebrate metagenome]|uniref:Thiol:disulfide oxidoreductase TlpA n=1 Tax=invertebrate metagenome TaxID=1711999 RepID=A0A484HA71_9ZZZZ
MSKRITLLLGMIIATTLTITSFSVALWCTGTQELPADRSRPQQTGILIPLDPPQPVPDVSILTQDGHQVTLAERAKGPLTVVNLWATWCLPCIREMPSLNRLRQAVAGITVLAISEDATLEQAQAFLVREGLTGLGLYHDPRGRLAQALGMQGLPSTYILQATGRVVARLEGEATWDSPRMIARLQALRAASTVSPVLPAEETFHPPQEQQHSSIWLTGLVQRLRRHYATNDT